MIVVSDTAPPRYLAVLGHLELLPRLFGQVFCPETQLDAAGEVQVLDEDLAAGY